MFVLSLCCDLFCCQGTSTMTSLLWTSQAGLPSPRQAGRTIILPGSKNEDSVVFISSATICSLLSYGRSWYNMVQCYLVTKKSLPGDHRLPGRAIILPGSKNEDSIVIVRIGMQYSIV